MGNAPSSLLVDKYNLEKVFLESFHFGHTAMQTRYDSVLQYLIEKYSGKWHSKFTGWMLLIFKSLHWHCLVLKTKVRNNHDGQN